MLTFDDADNLMQKLELDKDTIEFFEHMAGDILGNAQHNADTVRICDLLAAQPYQYEGISALCDLLAQQTGYHEYAVTAFILLVAAEKYHRACKERGISDEVYDRTVEDLRCKLNECMMVYGMHGIFVREWMFSYFKMQRFGLGRLSFELDTWCKEPILFNDNSLMPGDRFIGVHIPSEGKSFDAAARQESYQMALKFYQKEFSTPAVPFVCTSWLLDPANRFYLPVTSNIRNFADDFDMIIGRRKEKFTDGWRIFGAQKDRPIQELPEDSSLQKVFKKRLLNNDSFCNGCGIMWKKSEH